MEVIAGIDIGGTKCAVSFIHMNGDEVEFLSKEKRPTDESHPDEMVQSFVNEIAEKLNVRQTFRTGIIQIFLHR